MLRRSSLWRLSLALFAVLTLAAAASAQTSIVHVRNKLTDTNSDDLSTTPIGRLPVLFVHGHNTDGDDDPPNYQNNWQLPLNGQSSFLDALSLSQNDWLDIEAYYIQFRNQDHTIANDAEDIKDAIDRVLHRHDTSYDYPHNPAQTTNVKVVVIAYSKGTISTRLYLKNIQTERPGFRPVSEFIAIAPPNHGINTELAVLSTSGRQLMNGHGTNCTPFIATRNFIADLNGHPIIDTDFNPANPTATPGEFASEAPGSRRDKDPLTGVRTLPTDGTLYVTLFADGNRDFVGGNSIIPPPDDDCQGRRLAKNLSPSAVNLQLPIPGGNDATLVHQNTVHSPQVMCLALYAAVNHRSPEGVTCSDQGGVPIIPRAATVLTLDFSGSMTALVGPNRSRADELKQSVELFIRLWSEMGGASDRIGVNYFRTDVERYDLGGDHLPLLSDAANDLIDKVGRQDPNNSTALGGGLQWAIETLNGATNTPIRRVILFTDGMQNVNPMVRPMGGHHEIRDDGTNRPDSNVTPTNLRLDQLGGIKVDTIGIGTSPTFVGLLRDIAFETDGRSWPTADPAFDLRRFFVEVLINALRGFSPQLVAYRHGVVASKGNSEAFVVENGGRKLLLKVSWKRGDPIDFTVAKDGVDVSSSGRFIKGEFYKMFVVDFSAKGAPTSPGRWELRLKGRKGMAYETAAIVDGNRIKYDGLFDVKRPKVGDDLDLVVRLTSDGKPIPRDAIVTVKLMRPTNKALNFIASHRPKDLPTFEPGLTIPERRLLTLPMDRKTLIALKPSVQTATLKPTDKGEFRGRFRALVPGIYTAVVTIEGEDAKVGKFSRTLTASTVVRSER